MEKYAEQKGKAINLKKVVVENAPVQGNAYDCGVFVCQNAEKIARGVFVSTKQEDMPRARVAMTKEIFFERLLAESQADLREVVLKTKPEKKTNLKKRKIIKKAPLKNPAEQGKIGDVSRKGKIKWPKANSPEWARLDEDLTALLRVLYSPPEKSAASHPRVIYEICKERFGVKENIV